MGVVIVVVRGERKGLGTTYYYYSESGLREDGTTTVARVLSLLRKESLPQLLPVAYIAFSSCQFSVV